VDQKQLDIILGRVVLHYKLLSQEQVEESLRVLSGLSDRTRLEDVFLQRDLLDLEQVDFALKMRAQILAEHESLNSQAAHPKPVQTREAQAPPGPCAEKPLVQASPGPAPSSCEAPSEPEVPTSPALPSATASAVASPPPDKMLDRMLTHAVRDGVSDIHIHTGAAIRVRRFGVLSQMTDGAPPLARADAERMIYEILTADQRQRFDATNDLDFAYSLAEVGRFRVNVYRQQRGVDAVFRAIPPAPPTLAELGLPETMAKLTTYHQGLVLCTGPAGCGKTATMAALVNLVNQGRHDHIITVEDPIEYLHPSLKCSVTQRQVLKHTETFAAALRAALREDPDVIAIGELRDLETVSLAITAAETGHLVLATLHTNSAIRTINRVLDVFPPKQQAQVRAMVSESLRAIVSQRLVPKADGTGRVLALEVLITTPGISNLIREEKVVQIRNLMQTGKLQGMCLLDDSLLGLVKASVITKETARKFAEDPKLFA
jgi:twitching motility protein PilT